MRIPTYLDRYPAKMVSHLASRLVDQYAADGTHVFDPFSGSAAVPAAARERGLAVTGADLNPMANLFFDVKVRGFDSTAAFALMGEWAELSECVRVEQPIEWAAKHYWFSPGTLAKLEKLRAAWLRLEWRPSRETSALLLSLTLAVRLCSRADQRSPKPFISKQAKRDRAGRHYSPQQIMWAILTELADLYPRREASQARFLRGDIASAEFVAATIVRCSHIITSPPYINAQDYFRNFKLELHVLEGLLPFKVSNLQERFIGTERGDLLAAVPGRAVERYRKLSREIRHIEARNPRLGAVVQRYLYDMERSFVNMRKALAANGTLVLVCGDNMLAGTRIVTWDLLDRLLVEAGFGLSDRFTDVINDRMLAPKRLGHKGLIKREVISAYQRL